MTQLRAIERQAMIDDRLAAGGRLAASLARENQGSFGGFIRFCSDSGHSKESRLHNVYSSRGEENR